MQKTEHTAEQTEACHTFYNLIVKSSFSLPTIWHCDCNKINRLLFRKNNRKKTALT